jgi:hypothetical protein
MVCLRPSCTALPIAAYPRSKSRGAVPWYTTVQAAIAALPQGSSLRSGLCCPGPSSLSRPHAPHSPAHPDFTNPAYTRCLRCASKLQRLEATSVWFRAFADCSLSTCHRLRPRETRRLHLPSSFADNAGLRPRSIVSAFPTTPTLRFPWGRLISGLHYRSLSLQPAGSLASLSELTKGFPPANGDFYFRASSGWQHNRTRMYRVR